jgi:hypothetical protein
VSQHLDIQDPEAILKRVREQAARNNVFLTLHARQEMIDEAITLDEILEAIATGEVLENYPGFYKGPCCLVSGQSSQNRYIHIVCSTSREQLVIITVYEPKPPRWVVKSSP